MQVMGAHFGRIGAMASGKVAFDAKTAAENAAVVEFMSKLPFAGFVDGTDKGETRAKPQIWAEREKFNAGAMKMQEDREAQCGREVGQPRPDQGRVR